MDKANAEYIREEVEDLVSFSMSIFSFEDIIDASDKLTPDEKEWAKTHLDWSVKIIDI